MKKILITGASGFIGSFLVEKALEMGWETWAGIRKSSSREYLQDTRIRFIDLDYSNKEVLQQQIQSHVSEHGKWDYIVHNAGVTKCVKVSDFNLVNYQYTVNFIDALQSEENRPEKFILMSSLGALFSETAYGLSKLKAEQYLQSNSDIPYIILRPTGVYGPREKDYYMMLKTINAGLEVTAGFKPQRLTFIYIADLVQAVFLALESNLTKKIYAVSDGEVYTDVEYAKSVKKTLGKDFVLRIKVPFFLLYTVSVVSELFGRISGKPATLNRDKYKIMKQRDWSCSNQPLVDDLDFFPLYNLKDGLEYSVEWYERMGWI